METEVVMERKILGGVAKQRSKSGFFNASDFLIIANKWRIEKGMKPFDMEYWFRSNQTKEFISSLEKRFGVVKIAGRGRGTSTWVHPYIFIDLALAINPELKVEVYTWMYDHLLEYRNDSGDSYKKMCGYLYAGESNKTRFPKYIFDVAEQIREACGVSDWQKANEQQLKMRDKIHENICLLCDVLRDNDQAVRLGIDKTKLMIAKYGEPR